jgi:O-antigen/teichoic acid export membrane protein
MLASPAQGAQTRTAVASELNTAVKQSFIWGIGGVLTKAASFVMLPLYTHYLSPKDYGTWELLDLVMSLLGMLLNMGLTSAILKYYAAAETTEDKRKVISSSFVFGLITGCSVFGVGAAALPGATRALFGPGVSSIYLLLSFTYAIMAYVAAVPYTLMRARNQAQQLVAYDTAGCVLILVLNFCFVLFFKMGLLGVLLSPLIVGTIKTIVLFYWTRHDFGLSVDRRCLRQLLVFGGPLVLSNFTMFALNFSDRFFLRELRSLEVVGVYAVGYKFGYMLNFLVIQPFNMMWQARMFVIHKQEDHGRIFRHIFVLYSLVLIASGLALSLFGSTIFPLIVDSRYAGAVTIIPVITLAYVFLGIGYFLQVGMFLASRTVLVGAVSAAAAGADLVLNYFLIRFFGMDGAAWATLLGFFVLAAGSYFFAQRVCPLELGVARVCKAFLLAAGIYLISRWWTFASWEAGLLWKAALFGGFVALVWATGVVSADEAHTIKSVRESVVRATPRWLKPLWLAGS